MSSDNNRSAPSLGDSSSSELFKSKVSSIYERRPSTSDKPLLSLATAPPRAKSPSPAICPPTAGLAVKTDLSWHSQQQKSNNSIPQFLSLPMRILNNKFALLSEHEQTLRTMPNSIMFHPVARSRNRYRDVYPWEHHRIHLSSLQFGYINASPIMLRSATARGDDEVAENYIATQGPRDNGHDGGLFWEMCWQEKAEVVVMLTRPVEGGIEKCGVYYPETVGEVKRLGDWEVKCVAREEERGTVRRTLKLKRVPRAPSPVPSTSGSEKSKEEQVEGEETKETEQEAQQEQVQPQPQPTEEESGEERTIHHFLFLNWPDNDVPQSPEDIQSLLTLLNVSRIANNHSTTPRIIHCSAGVGRTGTFIALDHLSRELEKGQLDNLGKDDDPVFDTVKRLRDQRMLMVHRPTQYLMVYSVLREKWEAREKAKQLGLSERKEEERNMEAGERKALRPSQSRENGVGEKEKEKEIDEETEKETQKPEELDPPIPSSSSARKRKLIGDEELRSGKLAHTSAL
ncbi:tyrosine phosphatase 2 protein [Rutstroemia sp. NJR-2017a BVV2]|nr:tyrosine phosphatase 2 protein [Rutstroemia sp. NJR-2017a BVV2]